MSNTNTNTNTSNSTSTSNSTASTTDNSDHSVRNSGTGAVSNGGDATYVDSSLTELGQARANTGAAATNNQFGSGSIVSSATLASYVTGNSVTYNSPTGTTGGAPDNRLQVGDGSFSNLAGIQSFNINTGVAASQNSAINVSASVGTISLGM